METKTSASIQKFLELASKAYYAGNPVISDEQYDMLEEVYGELESPGYRVERGVPHFRRMYSLQKYYEGEGSTPDKDWNRASTVETPKLDGAAISILYIDGELCQVLTRGDGNKGQDVTFLFTVASCDNLKIPYFIPAKQVTQITGEVMAKKSIKNARNYAAGALGLKDVEEFLNRDLEFFAYDIFPNTQIEYVSQMRELHNWGFHTVLSDFDVEEYPTDGTVIRISKYKWYYAAGFTNKHPKGAYALKVRTEGVKTTLLDVIWQTGKSGKVTPVAILSPIDIDGAMVSRATLNNPGFIEALNLEIGDEVMVERSGGIIPRIITKVLKNDS